MKKRLFWTLFLSIACCSVVLVSGFKYLIEETENTFSYILPEHQQQLTRYAEQASQLIASKDVEGLASWISRLRKQENTWAAVVKLDQTWIGGQFSARVFDETRLHLGRDVKWPIHLSHETNPVMDIPLPHQNYHFLIQLPDRMRPGEYFLHVEYLMLILLPILITGLLSYLIYRHINIPVQELIKMTKAFASGDYQVRSTSSQRRTQDELSELANNFDQMADRIGELISSQRQLIQAISHELKTPITRLKLVMESGDQQQVISRVEKEVDAINGLVEDALTLAWFDNEKPVLKSEDVDVLALIDSIVEDAKFEFPNNEILLTLPKVCIFPQSDHRALGQAIENILRNAMKYSPINSTIYFSVEELNGNLKMMICDQGQGVPEDCLQKLFTPFFRVEASRARDSGGHGLGLTLVQRQCQAMGGSVVAKNRKPSGLCIEMTFPIKRNE
ncbi:MAG: histidine kinase sensor domain-containing protein [Parashewanella sp.]